MKYIFLDIDGVLNNERTVTRSPDGYVGISDSLTKRLEKIIKATGASVVLTSTWKDLSSPEDLAYMKMRLKRHFAAPIGKTHEKNLSLRGLGIKEFLKEHECEQFVILDDFTFDFEKEGLTDHLVLTNETDGLTEEDVERAIRILNGDLEANNYKEMILWGYHR